MLHHEAAVSYQLFKKKKDHLGLQIFVCLLGVISIVIFNNGSMYLRLALLYFTSMLNPRTLLYIDHVVLLFLFFIFQKCGNYKVIVVCKDEIIVLVVTSMITIGIL